MEDMKNIYEQVKLENLKSLDRIALGIKKVNGLIDKVTYREMFEKIDLCEENFKKLKIKEGYRIGLVAASSPEWIINYLAIQKMNATAVLLDASLDKEELLKLIDKSDLRVIVLSEDVKNKVGILENMPNIDIKLFGKLFKDNKCKKVKEITVKENKDVSTIIYSSGTTKTASGIMHRHDTLLKTTYMTINSVGLKKYGRFLGMLPNSHIYGVITQVLGPLLLSSAVYNLESLDAECLVGTLKECKPTIIPSVPKVYDLLYTQIKKKIESKKITKVVFEKLFPVCLKLRKKTGINLGKIIFASVQKGFGGKVQTICSAGSPLSEETANFYYGTGFNMLITYGATETNIPTIGNYKDNITMNSCGKNYPDVSIKIADNGELLIKSPYMMIGYFNDEETTKNAFTEDGWFLTGDLAKFNEDGNIVIQGRTKENIVLATGKKIAPDDVEDNYQNIPFVNDFAICGIPVADGSYDEIHCFVVAKEENKSEIESRIRQMSNESTKNMKIVGIHFVESIPRTSLKKPKRFLLKKMIEDENRENAEKEEKNTSDIIKVKQKTVKEVVYTLISEISKVHANEITDDTIILQELPIDSLSSIELAMELEKIYDLKLDKYINKNLTVSGLINLVENPPVTPKEKIKQYLTKYPLKKRKGDFHTFKFYSNIVKNIYKVTVKNDEVLPNDTGYIICSNHVSNFDYLFLTINFRKERFKKFYCVAKNELFSNNPFTKALVRIAGMIPIERTGNATETVKSVNEKLKDNSGVMIFPEGTRSKDGELGECKNGASMIALENKVPIIPAYIKGAFEVYPSGKKLPRLFNWKKIKRYEVNVIYGEPILPDGKTIDEITKELSDAIQNLASNIDCSNINKKKKKKKIKNEKELLVKVEPKK